MGEAVKDAVVARAVEEAAAEADVDAFGRYMTQAGSERGGLVAPLTAAEQAGAPQKYMAAPQLFKAVEKLRQASFKEASIAGHAAQLFLSFVVQAIMDLLTSETKLVGNVTEAKAMIEETSGDEQAEKAPRARRI